MVLVFALLPLLGRILLRSKIETMPEYRLDAKLFQVTDPPEWVGPDFVWETLHASGLDANASLLDEDLPQKALTNCMYLVYFYTI